jgi:hypothetical protein
VNWLGNVAPRGIEESYGSSGADPAVLSARCLSRRVRTFGR